MAGPIEGDFEEPRCRRVNHDPVEVRRPLATSLGFLHRVHDGYRVPDLFGRRREDTVGNPHLTGMNAHLPTPPMMEN